jgi:putative aldouronate transport system permease protein
MTDERKMKIISNASLAFISIITLLPIVLIIIASFTSEKALIANGYSFLPKELSLDAYYYMLKQGKIIGRAYGITEMF